MNITPDFLVKVLGCAPKLAAVFAKPIDDACKRWNISTKEEVAGFLGNLAEESGNFTRLSENLFYTTPARLVAVYPSRIPTEAVAKLYVRNPAALAEKVYGNRPGLGNSQPGDGAKFLGRGLIQLTGRANYTAYAKAAGVDVVNHPELLLDPHYAADSAGWYFAVHAKECKAFCNARNWSALTKKINGGLTNHAARMKYIERILNG